jgi:glycosyltransferase involved in cell wall biosynthesis
VPSAQASLPSPSVSACLVVRNEQAVIERCLESVRDVVDEVVLVHDGECEDRTLQIAGRYGCRIFVRPLVGHAEAATVFAFEQARGEWILSLDADEYLSEPMRQSLRPLLREQEVNGYEFVERVWDGKRYLTESGRYRLVLFRRSAVHLLGTIHASEVVDPPIRRTQLELEHRPAYNNFALSTVLTKWRRWARINAEEFLMEPSQLPRFNWSGPDRSPLRRRILNRLSPVLFPVYVPAVFVVTLVRGRHVYRLRENARMALYQALYAGMVQFYVAKRLYLKAKEAGAAGEAARPGSVGSR